MKKIHLLVTIILVALLSSCSRYNPDEWDLEQVIEDSYSLYNGTHQYVRYDLLILDPENGYVFTYNYSFSNYGVYMEFEAGSNSGSSYLKYLPENPGVGSRYLYDEDSETWDYDGDVYYTNVVDYNLYDRLLNDIVQYYDVDGATIDGDYYVLESVASQGTVMKLRINNDGYIDYATELMLYDGQEVTITEYFYAEIGTTEYYVLDDFLN